MPRILDRGAGWFARMGSSGSSGTKLLSVSGDCRSPGVYEVEFGTTLAAVLKLVGAEDARAVQMGGPSGQMLGAADFGRQICYDDLATGGAVMVFGPKRDLLEVVHAFLEFFVDESCGYCTPCRVGNVLLKQGIENVMAGRVGQAELAQLRELAITVKSASRCGLGQTSPNPVLSTLEGFAEIYQTQTITVDGMNPTFDMADALLRAVDFDLEAAVAGAAAIAGHASVHTPGLQETA